MTTAAEQDIRMIVSTEELHNDAFPPGTLVEEIHTGDCCDDELFCDVNPPQWAKSFHNGWTRSGRLYNSDDDEPRLPVQLLFRPKRSERSH